MDEKTADQLASTLMSQSDSALDTLAREELGIDPKDLGGSAWGAAITSFFLFAIGAIIPVFAFIFTGGITAVIICLILSTIRLFAIWAGVRPTTRSSLFKSGGRHGTFRLLAACITTWFGQPALATVP